MDNPLTVSPAYGRDYSTKTEVLKGWEHGRDFLIEDIVHPYCGKPMSVRDSSYIQAEGYDSIRIRFNKKADYTMVEL